VTASPPPSPDARPGGPAGPPPPPETQQNSGSTADDLGAAALSIGRLRTFLRRPGGAEADSAAGRWLDRFSAARRQPAVSTTLWNLSEGDTFEDGHTVLQVRRDVRAGTVQVVTSEPLTTPELPGDAPVMVIRR
jgi:hypothetical protein